MTKEQISELFNANRLDDADKALAEMAAGPEKAWTLYMQGRIAWKKGCKADAITYYEQAASLDPASEAATALEQAREVMDFFNKDLYNP